ncbi:hypothetical protein QFC19_008778 [Naganishia cerealis]|uniref:Uncharacterized protein n=1 Tax=Naganishia cerealis TaxID=610337 RepID=A0ACC2UZQ9_9TREE|nr:hypothetical protein QFC19_008778 [Naganishia cerealis]
MSSRNSPSWSGSRLGKRSRDDEQESHDSDDGSACSSGPRRNETLLPDASPPTSANQGTQNPSPFGCTYDGCVKAFATAAHRKRHERSRE